ncbi:transposase [Pseudonocardia kujensis]|uniref:transposase n=1 Tax=Pseudonocardia kujensis TaxID=1128675 RepID=UPI001E4B3BCC|nr:transposase [Pseudonocardia kujensis]MCE0765565.1 transposase [Pseudonocardia kujensis]
MTPRPGGQPGDTLPWRGELARFRLEFYDAITYSFVAALEPGRTSWTAMLDVVRIGPGQDAAAVTAIQLREVVDRLRAAGQWRAGDPPILIVADAGYDITRLAHVLADLPVELLGRLRSDRVLRGPRTRRAPEQRGARRATARTSPCPSPRPGGHRCTSPPPTPPATAGPSPPPGTGSTRA